VMYGGGDFWIAWYSLASCAASSAIRINKQMKVSSGEGDGYSLVACFGGHGRGKPRTD
jgi:hypothetical protein